MKEFSDHYHSSSSGGNLFRRVFTPRDRSPEEWRGGVLMVHGMGDHLGCHEKAAHMFCQHGLVAAGLDWPGHGHSHGKRGHAQGVASLMELITESLADLRERIPDGVPIGLYAHSAGAFVLMQFLREQASGGTDSVNHPSAFPFVWLSSPLLRPAHGQGWLKVKMSKWLAKVFPGMRIDTGIRSNRCYPPDPETGLLSEDPLKHHKVSLAMGVDLVRRSHAVDECAKVLQQTMRVLITQGEKDNVCPADYSRAFFDLLPLPPEHKTYMLLPGVLHEPLKDPGADDLLVTVGEWLEESLKAYAENVKVQ